MSKLIAKSPVSRVEIQAVVIRGNGYKEDLGRIAYWDRSWLKRVAWHFTRNQSGQLFIATSPVIGLVSVVPTFLATFMVHAGEAITTDLVTATGGTAPKYIGWGTGAGTTTRSDTTLFTEVDADLVTTAGTRVTGTITQATVTNTNDTVSIVGLYTSTTNAGTITNAGSFDGSTIGSNNLYIKGDFLGIGLNGVNGDSINFTMLVTYTD